MIFLLRVLIFSTSSSRERLFSQSVSGVQGSYFVQILAWTAAFFLMQEVAKFMMFILQVSSHMKGMSKTVKNLNHYGIIW